MRSRFGCLTVAVLARKFSAFPISDCWSNPAQRSNLFTAFSQAGTSITGKYGGTWLGLTICKKLVEAMGGEIGLDSKPGVSSTFHFTACFGAPVAQVSRSTGFGELDVPGKHTEQRPNPSPSRHAEYLQAQQYMHGRRLLLVDDSAENQDVTVEILQAAGKLVDVANDGRQALRMVSEARYDGVLMDCMMPVIDGFETTQKIRAAWQPADLPILAMHSQATANIREKCLASGMNDCLAKPIDHAELFVTLARWVKPALTFYRDFPISQGCICIFLTNGILHSCE